MGTITNAVVEPSTASTGETDNGASVTISCPSKYYLIGGHPAVILTCQKGSWSEEIPACKKPREKLINFNMIILFDYF